MAPEIMQLQKYDAKVRFTYQVLKQLSPYNSFINFRLIAQADLWSVGAILFQLVTGRTPFTGSNQIQVSSSSVSSKIFFPFFSEADFAHKEDPSCLKQYIDLILQLLQNIIKSTELQFPPEAKDLNPHCLDLCRKLLRRNPGNHHVLNLNMLIMLDPFAVLAITRSVFLC